MQMCITSFIDFIASRFLEACESCYPSCQSAIRIPGCQLVKATSINILIGNHRKSSKFIESKVLLVVFGGASPETSCRTAMRAFRAWIVHF
jgi:hypothetical protein